MFRVESCNEIPKVDKVRKKKLATVDNVFREDVFFTVNPEVIEGLLGTVKYFGQVGGF